MKNSKGDICSLTYSLHNSVLFKLCIYIHKRGGACSLILQIIGKILYYSYVSFLQESVHAQYFPFTGYTPFDILTDSSMRLFSPEIFVSWIEPFHNYFFKFFVMLFHPLKILISSPVSLG